MTAKHRNLPIFIPHAGCPHRCSFCDQHAISGAQKAPTPKEVAALCERVLLQAKNPQQMEIAFFGGSFTAIDAQYRRALLACVQPFLGGGGFSGIRISTRPDAVPFSVLQELWEAGVTAVELGAQSLSDRVLRLNQRGHTSQDVYAACDRLRQFDWQWGLQMMIGLYGSTMQDEQETLRGILSCHPDTVRLYPVVVLEHTPLAQRVLEGSYRLPSWDFVLDFCSGAWQELEQAGISLIRCGLHDSPELRAHAVAGFYHPAFGELVRSRLYRRFLEQYLERKSPGEKSLSVCVSSACLSQAIGQKRCNIRYFEQRGVAVSITGTDALPNGQIGIGEEVYDVFKGVGAAGL